MKTMKSLGVILAAALAGAACAPVTAADRPEDQPEFHRPPANAQQTRRSLIWAFWPVLCPPARAKRSRSGRPWRA